MENLVKERRCNDQASVLGTETHEVQNAQTIVLYWSSGVGDRARRYFVSQRVNIPGRKNDNTRVHGKAKEWVPEKEKQDKLENVLNTCKSQVTSEDKCVFSKQIMECFHTHKDEGNEESKKKFKEHVETAGKECYEKHNPTDGINEAPSTPVTERVKQKWKSILCKNNGHGALCPNINSKLVGIESPENEGLSLRDCNDVRFFRFAPIKSCDVERIFSQYKLCLVDN
ncbi:hypothetical protein ANN_02789 [Periplaneta americana]|uniref:Uncharacterized protein n=1 Tax=Periplaneta americana TaxID=6978 RepID=A0ABQ8TYY9_PERAM|nr:hypothetical protein ANN_02789 [Periplaneta americana]